jgi:hypothetical protein
MFAEQGERGNQGDRERESENTPDAHTHTHTHTHTRLPRRSLRTVCTVQLGFVTTVMIDEEMPSRFHVKDVMSIYDWNHDDEDDDDDDMQHGTQDSPRLSISGDGNHNWK